GNLTGVSILSSELNGKRQEILIDLLPGVLHIAAVVDPGTVVPLQLETLRNAAASRGVELSTYAAANPEEIASAIDSLSAAGAPGLTVLPSPLLSRYRRVLIDRSAARSLPTIYQWPDTAEEGGLIAYGPRFTQIYRQLARQLVKLLRGKAGRPAGRAADQVRTGDQSQHCEGARPHRAAIRPRPRRRDDRLRDASALSSWKWLAALLVVVLALAGCAQVTTTRAGDPSPSAPDTRGLRPEHGGGNLPGGGDM